MVKQKSKKEKPLKQLTEEEKYNLWKLAFDCCGRTIKIEKNKLTKKDLNYLDKNFGLKYWEEPGIEKDYLVFQNKDCN